MNKNLKALLIIIPCSLSGDTFKTSQTFMFTRPIYHNLAAQAQHWNKAVATKSHDGLSAAQVIGLYQHSRDSDRIKRYFLLDCKKQLLIAGDNSTNTTKRDVRAEWLGLPSDFSGLLTIAPEQRQIGFWLEFNQDLKNYISWKILDTWWFDIAIPIVIMKNNLRLSQSNIQNPGTSAHQPHDIIQAFNQPAWDFAKMDNCSRSKAGVAEIKFSLGGTYLDDNDFLLAYYGFISIPTSNKQKPHHIFSAYIGPNGHVDVGAGFNLELPLHDPCSACKAWLFLNIEDHYYLHNHQLRTFDLRDHECNELQWSRYMLLRKPGETETVPAMNITTQRVKVRPYNIVDLSTGFKFAHAGLECELGYDLWAKHSERICPVRPCCEGSHFPIEKYGIAGTGISSAQASTIAMLADNDPVFIHLKESDINFRSGASRGGFTNRLHAAACFTRVGECHDLFAGAGIFYERPHTNNALENWGFWLKIGDEF